MPVGPVNGGQDTSISIGSTEPGILVRVNGQLTQAAGRAETPKPGPAIPIYRFRPPAGAIRAGENVVEVSTEVGAQIEWVEILFA